MDAYREALAKLERSLTLLEEIEHIYSGIDGLSDAERLTGIGTLLTNAYLREHPEVQV